MPRVFNNEYESHPWKDGIEELRTREATDCAYAQNLTWDPHITERRHEVARAFVEAASADFDEADRLKAGLKQYFLTRVREALPPDFVDLDPNDPAKVAFATPDRDGILPGLDLVRVLDLSGLETIYYWGRKKENLDRYLDLLGDEEVPLRDFLDRGLKDQYSADRDSFLGRLFDMVNDYMHGVGLPPEVAVRGRPFHPVWATLANRLDPDADPETWLKTLGIPKFQPNRWLILLRYNHSDGFTLIRPTSLDSEPSGYFFPTPTWELEIPGTGASMDFDAVASDITPEWIHVQQELKIKAWLDAGEKCKKTTLIVDCVLKPAREAHRVKLQRDLDTGTWMNPAI